MHDCYAGHSESSGYLINDRVFTHDSRRLDLYLLIRVCYISILKAIIQLIGRSHIYDSDCNNVHALEVESAIKNRSETNHDSALITLKSRDAGHFLQLAVYLLV